MRTPETAGFEPATEQALGLLFVSAASRIVQYGTYDTSQSVIYDHEEDGLPITDVGPAWRFILNANVLREQFPEQTETLGVGGNVGLTYVLQHYSLGQNYEDLLYSAPMCQFRIPKEDDLLRPETLYVELGVQNGNKLIGRADRYRESAMPRAIDKAETLEKKWEAEIEAKRLQIELGLDKISRDECTALQTIVKHLGTLAERQAGQDQTEP
jgi:hypothetical protein